MGLNFNGNPPAFGGKIVAEVPTPTYSGKKSSDPDDAINPYTDYGPGGFETGATEDQIEEERMGNDGSDPYGTNVVLLAHLDNTLDDVTTRNTISAANGTPFGTGKFNEGTVHNGTNQFLIVPYTDDFNLGNTFTVECWIKTTDTDADIIACFNSDFTNAPGFDLSIDPSGYLRMWVSDGDANGWVGSTATVNDNAWHHVAASNDSNTMRLFVDGALVTTEVLTRTALGSGHAIHIGASTSPSPSRYYGGSIDDVRITKDVARYTSAFTAPDLPFPDPTPRPADTDSDWSSVSFLAPYDFDSNDHSNNSLSPSVTQGILQSSNVEVGARSTNLTGGTYNRFENNDAFFFGTSADYTIEMWVYYNSDGGSTIAPLLSTWDNGIASNSWQVEISSALATRMYSQHTGSPVFVIGTADSVIPVQQWTHIAFTRASGTNYIFVDGAQEATNTTDSMTSNGQVNRFYIGRQAVATGRIFDGNLDDIRLTQGVARYTAPFTPPTAPFPTS